VKHLAERDVLEKENYDGRRLLNEKEKLQSVRMKYMFIICWFSKPKKRHKNALMKI
jgi:hypothetical protein